MFDNSYARLPEVFYEHVYPVRVKQPTLIRLNTDLAAELGLELPDDEQELASIFSGNTLLDGSTPIAQAYAGHQFGNFVPQLGDGRAVLLGETVTADNRRYDIQLKGSGKTPFSRGGDGRSPLGPVIREYIVSEAMHALGIPTTRALAMVTTGEQVRREEMHPGGVFTRVAASLVRVGTFEYFAARHNKDAVKQLADYVIDRHYPEAREADNPYAALFQSVCRAQASLVAKWMSVGFIHGVMNTDNTTISGETIDFGPCAFMDHYNPAQVFSSIDHQGRYAYNNQPTIAQWNMACLGSCLLTLLHDDPAQAKQIGETILESFIPTFKEQYYAVMCRKIGLPSSKDNFQQAKSLLELMHKGHVDFTTAFRLLSNALLSAENAQSFTDLFGDKQVIQSWFEEWQKTLKAQDASQSESAEAMRQANPAFIPRNHRIEEAIRAAEDHNDFAPTHKLIEILATPYDDQPDNTEYLLPPKPEERVMQTFCGT